MLYFNEGNVPNLTSGVLMVVINGGFEFLSKSLKSQVWVNWAQFCEVNRTINMHNIKKNRSVTLLV